MNVIVVVDSLDSALGHSALARKRYEESLIIAANKYPSPRKLLEAVKELNPSVVLFTFRNIFLDSLSMKSSFSLLRELHDVATFGLLIPDYLEIENCGSDVSALTRSSIDFILTTNRDLESKYKEKFGDSIPIMTYHDLVDLSQVNSLRNLDHIKPGRIIWIGNSKWGERQGKNDHKGFREVISPLLESLSPEGANFKIIDSATKKVKHQEVLEELSRSSILLHPSASEGTGLPILEAALMGCFPITTDVGIAKELLGDDFSFLIADRQVDDFKGTISIVEELGYLERQNLVRAAELFVMKVSQERIPRDLLSKKTTIPHRPGLLQVLNLLVRWSYRFISSWRT